eukprot:Gb_37015 [translate_table: standard]
MDALTQSFIALNVNSAQPAQGLRSQEPAQQLPIALLAPGSRSSRPVAPNHFSISKTGIGIASRSSFTHDALALKIPHGEGRAPGQRALVVMRDSAASGYAAAVLEIAESNNMLEVINGDMDKLSHLLRNQELYDFLINPIIEDKKKKSILRSISDDANFQTYTLNFLNLLIDKKRIDIVKIILKEFEMLYNELTDTQVVVVSSALKLENRQLSQIAKKIQSLTGAKNVKLKSIIDSSLIAGFVITYGKNASRIIDMSVKGQLEKLSAQIDSTEKVAAF